jgi:hypothetical protein
MDIVHYFANGYHLAIKILMVDVIETYNEFFHHWHTIWQVDDKLGPHLLFLQFKPKWSAFDDV